MTNVDLIRAGLSKTLQLFQATGDWSFKRETHVIKRTPAFVLLALLTFVKLIANVMCLVMRIFLTRIIGWVLWVPRLLHKIIRRVIVYLWQREGEMGEDRGGERNICQREDTENKLTDAQFKPCLHSNYSKWDLFFPEESPSLLWNLCVLMDLLKIHFDLIKAYKNRTTFFFLFQVLKSVNLNNCMQGQFGGPRSNWWIKNQHSLKTGSSWTFITRDKFHSLMWISATFLRGNFYNSVIKNFHGVLKFSHLYRFLGPKESNERETR